MNTPANNPYGIAKAIGERAAHIPPPKTIEKPGEIDELLGRLASSIEDTRCACDGLVLMIDPILAQPEPRNNQPEPYPEPSCAMAARLHGLLANVRAIQQDLLNLKTRARL